MEVGGIRGREALDRLRNVVGRVESSWRPATAEEEFGIVRRRLFEPIPGDQFKNRDLTARGFSELSHAQASEFPPECRTADSRNDSGRLSHSSRGVRPAVLRLVHAGEVPAYPRGPASHGGRHSLPVGEGRQEPVDPALGIPIDDARVQFELTPICRTWAPIIERDVDGPNSLPLRIDTEQPNLGRLNATRRVARTMYMGSAPTAGAAHRGLEDRRVTLGCVMPGEPPAVFGDALRRLAGAATYCIRTGPASGTPRNQRHQANR